ncbi:hypothetical protein GH714_018008 [Hevea brasiliensis]|uniref:Myb/SANT-like domain-containing protein n=1 Tax=Hevea brasiliensis TaxID=3981 RepID=A0A6A6M3A2_HEVBR|nr:hypothetical protein GH714_018008 [Hevea brasiliensis]
MDFVESSQVTRGRGKNKRIWTSEKDNALVEALQEVATYPKWKKENGWKNGYLLRVEELINAKLPNSGLKASPHNDSRWKILKAKYNAMADMLNKSGFGQLEKVETFVDAIENMEKEMTVDLDKDDLFEDMTGNHSVDQYAIEKEIAYENKRVTEQKKMVVNELLEIEGLTETEVMYAAVILKAEQHKREVFYELPTNLRKQFIINLLSECT